MHSIYSPLCNHVKYMKRMTTIPGTETLFVVGFQHALVFGPCMCNCMHVQSCTWVPVLRVFLGVHSLFGTGRLVTAGGLAVSTGGCGLFSWTRGPPVRLNIGRGWNGCLGLHLCNLLQRLLKLLLKCWYLCRLRSVLHIAPIKNIRPLHAFPAYWIYEHACIKKVTIETHGVRTRIHMIMHVILKLCG